MTLEAILNRDERFRLLIERAGRAFFFMHEQEHGFTYLSPTVRELLGYAPEELLGRHYEALLPDRSLDVLETDLLQGGSDAEERSRSYMLMVHHKEGSAVQLQITAGLIGAEGGVVGILGLAQEVRTSIRTPGTPAEGDEHFRRILEQIPYALWLFRNGELLYVSPAYERIWRRSLQELRENPRVWIDTILPADLDRVLSAVVRMWEREESVDFRIARPDGSIAWLRSHGVPVLSEGGNVSEVVGITWETTEEMQREIRLRERLARFQLVGHVVTETIWEWDFRTDRVHILSTPSTNAGDSALDGEFTLEWALQQVPMEDREELVARVDDVLAGRTETFEVQHRGIGAKGGTVMVVTRGHLVRDADGVKIGIVGSSTVLPHEEASHWGGAQRAPSLVAGRPVVELFKPVPEIGARAGAILVPEAGSSRVGVYYQVEMEELPEALRGEVEQLTLRSADDPDAGRLGDPRSLRERAAHLRLLP